VHDSVNGANRIGIIAMANFLVFIDLL